MVQAGSGGGEAAAEQVMEAAEGIEAAALPMAGNAAVTQANGRVASVHVNVGNIAAVVAAAAAPAAAIVAGPVIANLAVPLAGPLVPLGGIQPVFDVEAVLLGPLPTKSNLACEIMAWIDEA